MRKSLRLLSLLTLWALILPGNWRPSSRIPPKSLTVTLEAPSYRVATLQDGSQQIEMEGFSPQGAPGEAGLPARLYRIALPPTANLKSLKATLLEVKWVEVEGAFSSQLAGAPAALVGGQPLALQAGVSQERMADRDGPVALVSAGQLRGWQVASLQFSPVQPGPAAGELRLAAEVQVRLAWTTGVQPAVWRHNDPAADERASLLLENYAQARAWYANPQPTALAAGASDYVIITTNAIRSASARLAGFIAHKQALGHTVEVITEDQFGSLTGQAPNGTPEKVRQWLKENYLPKGIQYVLLIGDPDPDDPRLPADSVGDLPMKMTWPRLGDTNDDYDDAATDYFYADLTGNWDLDGDGLYGEYASYGDPSGDNGPGGVDFLNEVNVGRIPVYTGEAGWAAALDAVLQKTMDYETSPDRSWRKAALLPMGFSADITDGAYLGERMKADYLTAQGFNTFTMYQHKTTGCNSTFPSDRDLTDGAALDQWMKNAYGLVAWWTHGNWDRAKVGYGSGACGDGYVLMTPDVADLDDNHPSILFQGACWNADPTHPDSLTNSLLNNGAVASVSGTSLTVYEDYAWSPSRSLADTASVGYYFMQRVAEGQPVGRALYDEKSQMGPGWGDETWMNLLSFNLIGDPALGVGVFPSPAAPTGLSATAGSQSSITLAWTDNSSDESGFKIERSPDGLKDWTQVDSVAANVTTYTDNSLACGTGFYYRVRSYGAQGDSGPSNTAAAVTAFCSCTASQPEALACGAAVSGNNSAAGSSDKINVYPCATYDESGPEYIYRFTAGILEQVNLTLSNLAVDLDVFVLKDQGAGCNAGGCVAFGDTTASFLAQAGETYYVSVDGSNGAVGSYTLAVNCSPAPLAPGGLSAAAVSHNQINLAWNDNSDNETSFKIERSPDGTTGWTQVGTAGANLTSYQSKALQENTPYFYRVRAANAIGNSPYSNTASAVTQLGPPGALSATAATQTRIDLAWVDNSSSESGFRIERSPAGAGAWTGVYTATANTSTYADTGLAVENAYDYRVRAFSAGGTSAWSNTASEITLPNLPLAPGGLLAVADSQTQIVLTWTDTITNETGFDVQRSLIGTPQSGDWMDVGALPANTTTYLSQGLNGDTTYYYRVRATNRAGSSGWSNTASAATLPYAASAPLDLVATAVSPGQINLAWTDGSDNEAGFKIEQSLSGTGGWGEAGSVPAGGTAYAVTTGLAADTRYFFRVYAYNAGGASPYSNTAEARTLPEPPAAPAGLSAGALSQTQIGLSWTDSSANEAGFKLERCTGPACTDFTLVAMLGAGAVQYVDAGRTTGQIYRYRLYAYNAGGNSAFSNIASASASLPPPSNLKAAGVSASQVTLTWTDNSANEAGFQVERCSGEACTGFVTVATLPAGAGQYEDGGLASATLYQYRVAAYIPGGDPSYSGVTQARTRGPTPRAPEDLAAQFAPGGIQLGWSDRSEPGNNETGFVIERSLTGGTSLTEWAEIARVGADEAAYFDPTAACDTTLYYRVRAFNTNGESAASNPASATRVCTSAGPQGVIYLPLIRR